jgi:hypothetical protein
VNDALGSSETSVLTRATRRNIQEDTFIPTDSCTVLLGYSLKRNHCDRPSVTSRDLATKVIMLMGCIIEKLRLQVWASYNIAWSLPKRVIELKFLSINLISDKCVVPVHDYVRVEIFHGNV